MTRKIQVRYHYPDFQGPTMWDTYAEGVSADVSLKQAILRTMRDGDLFEDWEEFKVDGKESNHGLTVNWALQYGNAEFRWEPIYVPATEIVKMTQKLQDSNPEQAFWVEVSPTGSSVMCVGATNADSGEVVPILAATITGHVLPYHGCAVDGKPIEHEWVALNSVEVVAQWK